MGDLNGMYTLSKALNLPEEIDLPTNMYRMKKVFTLPENLEGTDKDHSIVTDPMTNKSDRCYEELQNRQKNILNRLKLFKGKLDTLAQNSTFAASPQITGSTVNKNCGVIHDIVIACNSDQPPYSILILKKVLEQCGNNVLLSNAIHSSVESVNDKLWNLFRDKSFKPRSDHNIALTIIWKDQQYKSLMLSPINQRTIEGEVNILRYISRLLPATAALNYESAGSFTQILTVDHWLDVIQANLLHGSNRERQASLKQINAKLGSSKFICGPECGIVDVFGWSVIHQLNLNASLPNHISTWLQNVSNCFSLSDLKEINR